MRTLEGRQIGYKVSLYSIVLVYLHIVVTAHTHRDIDTHAHMPTGMNMMAMNIN